MRRLLALFLLLSLLTQNVYGQTGSCEQRLQNWFDYVRPATAEVPATGFATPMSLGLAAGAGARMLGAGSVVFAQFFLGGVGVGVLVAVGLGTGKQVRVAHRRAILRLFQGAANGGNRVTLRLFKKMKKRLPKGMAYAAFLAEIHQGDIDGSACPERMAPSKQHIIEFVDLTEIQDEDDNEYPASAVSEQTGKAVAPSETAAPFSETPPSETSLAK